MIGRRQFAQLALKCGVGREENALPDFHRVCLAVFLHQGHRFQRARHELDGPCEVVVVEHRLHEVRPNEASSARDEDLHCLPSTPKS